jgi:predicted DNA-binding protein (MmcQ/YjbR family)
MFIDEIRTYCLSKAFTEETLPFDEDTLVFKVMGKMFALISISAPDTINLKCDPEYAVELRERYTAVQPGWHMSKKHWNTVALHDDLEANEIKKLIDHSFDEVVKKLPKKLREQFENYLI